MQRCDWSISQPVFCLKTSNKLDFQCERAHSRKKNLEIFISKWNFEINFQCGRGQQYTRVKLGVDSSSGFSFRARTHRDARTHKVTDVADQPRPAWTAITIIKTRGSGDYQRHIEKETGCDVEAYRVGARDDRFSFRKRRHNLSLTPTCRRCVRANSDVIVVVATGRRLMCGRSRAARVTAASQPVSQRSIVYIYGHRHVPPRDTAISFRSAPPAFMWRHIATWVTWPPPAVPASSDGQWRLSFTCNFVSGQREACTYDCDKMPACQWSDAKMPKLKTEFIQQYKWNYLTFLGMEADLLHHSSPPLKFELSVWAKSEFYTITAKHEIAPTSPHSQGTLFIPLWSTTIFTALSIGSWGTLSQID